MSTSAAPTLATAGVDEGAKADEGNPNTLVLRHPRLLRRAPTLAIARLGVTREGARVHKGCLLLRPTLVYFCASISAKGVTFEFFYFSNFLIFNFYTSL